MNGKARPAVAVGIDVGGSAIKAGRIDDDGKVRAEASVPVPHKGPADAATLLAAAAREVGARAGVPIGVGVPGLLERASGTVLQSPNLPWLDGVAIRAALAAALRVDEALVQLENDANVAALGEQWRGAAEGQRHACLVTLGTGVGGGLILNGALFVGEGLAGELGHVTIDPHGPVCGCGGRGCLEVYASATAARRRASERNLPEDAPGDLELLTERARAGSSAESRLLEEIGRDLGRGLGAVVSLLDVRTFVVGGGFAAALDQLEPGIRAGLRESTFGARVEDVRVVRAKLGPSAGWIGAARLALVRAGAT